MIVCDKFAFSHMCLKTDKVVGNFTPREIADYASFSKECVCGDFLWVCESGCKCVRENVCPVRIGLMIMPQGAPAHFR